MASVKIFVRFEFDKDNDLKNNFFEEAQKQSPHRVLNSSLNEAYPDRMWKDKAKSAIRACDIVIVLVGQDTHNAQGVKTELAIACQLKKPVIQVVPQRRSFSGVAGIGEQIRWIWKRVNKKIDEVWTQKQHG